MNTQIIPLVSATILVALVIFCEVRGFREEPSEKEMPEKDRAALSACIKKCPADAPQVCGEMGDMRSSACELKCMKLKEAPASLCKCMEKCDDQPMDPVCVEGRYVVRESRCDAKCLGEKEAKNSTYCDRKTECLKQPYKPVCGSDGNLYYNVCSMKVSPGVKQGTGCDKK